MKKEFNVAVVGCGTVGGATASLLLKNKEHIKTKTGINYNLKYIYTIDTKSALNKGFSKELLADDFNTILKDPEVDLVVELVGGTTYAKEYVEQALNAKKHVVTANKALLAKFGKELFGIARKNNVSIGFEASCGGGIPVVRAIYDGLMANQLTALYGIVNGTCNYILTAMIEQGKGYNEVLKEAQAAGLAEADPTLDVNGMDSAHKLTILSSLAFGMNCDLNKIPVTGIDSLQLEDVKFAQEMGYTIKLLAVAEKKPNGLSLRVRPAFISKDHPLAWVSGAFNAVSIYGDQVGHTMYYGRGAGGTPTASAVVSDIISTGLGYNENIFQQLNIWQDKTEPAVQLTEEKIESRYYIRLEVEDKPGVFALITNVLSEEGISITGAIQHEPNGRERIPVVITTHQTSKGKLEQALTKLKQRSEIVGIYRFTIIEEHTEFQN